MINIKRNILLNPGPATTTQTVKEALVVSDICPREKEFGDLVGNIRHNLKKVVCTSNIINDYETILIPGSGTYAVESVLVSAISKKILILINGAYGHRMKEICQTYGIESDELIFEFDNPVNVDQTKKYLEKNYQKYCAVSFIHHETTTGVINSLDNLLEIIHCYNLISIVDCMSSFAGYPIDLEKTPMDFLISSSNKCIQGMAGVGIIIANKKTLENIKNNKKRSYSLDLYSQYACLKFNNQFLFTPPVQILYALNQAVNEFLEEGASNRFKRYHTLYSYLLDGMVELGFKYIVQKEYHSGILTSFYCAKDDMKFNFDKMHDYLYSKGITIYPGKVDKKDIFRLANLGDLKIEDIQFTINEIKNFLVL